MTVIQSYVWDVKPEQFIQSDTIHNPFISILRNIRYNIENLFNLSMLMIKKRKKHIAVTTPVAELVAKTIEKPSWIHWFNQPVLSMKSYQWYGSLVGYSLSIAGVMIVASILISGYTHRPVIVDDQIIQKIVQSDVVKKKYENDLFNHDKNEVLFNNENTAFFQSDGEKPNSIYMKYDQNKQSAVMIPMKYVNIPKNFNQLSFSLSVYYSGTPTVHIGFVEGDQMMGTEINLIPSPGEYLNSVTIPSTIRRDQLTVNWDEAEYLSITCYTNSQTEMLITKLMIMGYH